MVAKSCISLDGWAKPPINWWFGFLPFQPMSQITRGYRLQTSELWGGPVSIIPLESPWCLATDSIVDSIVLLLQWPWDPLWDLHPQKRMEVWWFHHININIWVDLNDTTSPPEWLIEEYYSVLKVHTCLRVKLSLYLYLICIPADQLPLPSYPASTWQIWCSNDWMSTVEILRSMRFRVVRFLKEHILPDSTLTCTVVQEIIWRARQEAGLIHVQGILRGSVSILI